MIRVVKTFPGHEGRPGQVGGSVPRSESSIPAGVAPGIDDRLHPSFSDKVRKKYYAMDIYAKAEAHFDGRLKETLFQYIMFERGLDTVTPGDARQIMTEISQILGSAESQRYKDIGGFWLSDNVRQELRGAIKHELITAIAEKAGVPYETVNNIIGQWAETSNGESTQSISLQIAAAEEFGLTVSEWQKDTVAFGRLERLEPYKAKYYELYKQHQETNAALQDTVNRMFDNTLTLDEADALDNQRKALITKRKSIRQELIALGEDYSNDIGSVLDVDKGWIEDYVLADRATERKVLRAMYEHTQEQLKAAGLTEVVLYRGIKQNLQHPISAKPGEVVDYKGNPLESWSLNTLGASPFAGDYGVVFAIKVPIASIISTARTGFGCFNEGEFVVMDTIPGAQAIIYENRALRDYLKPTNYKLEYDGQVIGDYVDLGEEHKTFPGHKGRPGEVGGSVARDLVSMTGQLTQAEIDAIDSYKGGDWNAALYSSTPTSGIMGDLVSNIDKAIDKSVLEEDITLYRGVSFLQEDLKFAKTQWTAARTVKAKLDPFAGKVGEDIPLPGFTSTTTDIQAAKVFARERWANNSSKTPNPKHANYILEIKVPKGTHALDLNNYGGNSVLHGVAEGEKEILLPRNGTIRITSISQPVNGISTITAEWVNNTAYKTFHVTLVK